MICSPGTDGGSRIRPSSAPTPPRTGLHRSSTAEWTVAKHGYVAGRSGWFSCRSACYLAAGRPVVVQDTGFSEVLPVGEGIVAFETPEEAAEGVRSVRRDYARHARAARELAAEYFAAEKVLPPLIDAAGS